MFVTPVVVLLGSSGGLESGVELGLERLALTAVAAVLAVGAAAYFDRIESRRGRDPLIGRPRSRRDQHRARQPSRPTASTPALGSG